MAATYSPQIRRSDATAGIFYAEDRAFAGGLKTTNTAAQNDAAVQALFTSMRAQAALTQAIAYFPPGRFQMSDSFSPSGMTNGLGSCFGAGRTLVFDDTYLEFTGTVTNYNQITLSTSNDPNHDNTITYNPLTSYSPSGNMPIAASTPQLTDGSNNYTAKYVAFDIRNCANLCIRGKLTLDCNNLTGLVGMASSGGSYKYFENATYNNNNRSGMADGSIESLEIIDAHVGLFSVTPNSSGSIYKDTWTGVHIGNYKFAGYQGYPMVVDRNFIDGMRIDQFEWVSRYGSIINGNRAVSFGTGFVTMGGSAITSGGTQNRGHVICFSDVVFDGVYGRINNGSSNATAGATSLFEICNETLFTVHNLHFDTALYANSGYVVLVKDSPTGADNLQCHVTLNCGGRLDDGSLSVVGIDASNATAKRVLELSAGALTSETNVLGVVSGSATTTDVIWRTSGAGKQKGTITSGSLSWGTPL